MGDWYMKMPCGAHWVEMGLLDAEALLASSKKLWHYKQSWPVLI